MTTIEPRVLLDGLAYVESPRWHDGRLWFAHWGAEEIIAVDLDGNAEVMGQGPPGLGWSIDWLPDGTLLITGPDLQVHDADGSLTSYGDTARVADHGWNEIVVDGRGNTYLNGFDFDFLGGQAPEPGIIALLTAEGEARQVACDIDFPNGMVITPDNSTLVISESFAGRLTAFDIDEHGDLSNRRVWADGLGPDSITMDAEGCIWTHSADTFTHTDDPDAPQGEVVRVREGGEVLDRIPMDRAGFGNALGGPDGTTLFMVAADWRGPDKVDEALADRTGQVLVAEAPAPGVGWP